MSYSPFNYINFMMHEIKIPILFCPIKFGFGIKSGNNNAMKTILHLRTVFFYIKNTGEYFADPFTNFKASLKKSDHFQQKLNSLYSTIENTK